MSGDGFDPYGAAFEQSTARIGERVKDVIRETTAAAALLTDLLAEAPARRRERIHSEPRLWTVKLCDRLIAGSRAAWASDPAQAVELADLAVQVAERLDVRLYGQSLVADARTSAWAYLGNACRIASDLHRAEEALDVAGDFCSRYAIDILTEAEVLGFRASLWNSLGRFAEAGQLLDRALELYREAGDTHQQGRTLILKGMIVGDSGSFREAIRLLRQGLSIVDAGAEPGLLLAARHNLILFLNDGGSHQEALETLEQSRHLYTELGGPLHHVRLRWLEGRIALGLGRLDEAEGALRVAREAFLEQEICFDAALVSLDLAMVHFRKGDAAEVKRLAVEIVPVLRACGVHEETLAALLLFREAAEAERVTAAFLDRLAGYLRRARHAPDLRFDG